MPTNFPLKPHVSAMLPAHIPNNLVRTGSSQAAQKERLLQEKCPSDKSAPKRSKFSELGSPVNSVV
jgi:hypothetical protein